MTAEEKFMFEDQTRRMDALRAQLDAAQGEAAGLRRAVEEAYEGARRSMDEPRNHATDNEYFSFIAEHAARALATPGKSISEWQAEALESVIGNIENRFSFQKGWDPFMLCSELTRFITEEAARLRGGGTGGSNV